MLWRIQAFRRWCLLCLVLDYGSPNPESNQHLLECTYASDPLNAITVFTFLLLDFILDLIHYDPCKSLLYYLSVYVGLSFCLVLLFN